MQSNTSSGNLRASQALKHPSSTASLLHHLQWSKERHLSLKAMLAQSATSFSCRLCEPLQLAPSLLTTSRWKHSWGSSHHSHWFDCAFWHVGRSLNMHRLSSPLSSLNSMHAVDKACSRNIMIIPSHKLQNAIFLCMLIVHTQWHTATQGKHVSCLATIGRNQQEISLQIKKLNNFSVPSRLKWPTFLKKIAAQKLLSYNQFF